jgi:transcriptional regulator with XRE-family HTH domain
VATNKKILVIIGNNIRKIRKTQKMSQSQLAFEAGVTREFINKLETGKYNVSILTLEKISTILETEISNLLKE